MYLLLLAGLGTGTLSARGRLNLLVGGMTTAVSLIVGWYFIDSLLNG